METDAKSHFFIGGFGCGDEGSGSWDGPSFFQRIAALTAARAAADQDYSHRLLRLERRSQMKKGPPASAVITPTGISVGARTVRERVSQRARKAAPKRKEHGSNARWSAPSFRRRAWGTMSPTNPMGPVSDVTIPVK